tara:strand:- start:625 stop:783 length:159 start_codon:yes stop_codon:yes gene_type:complete
VSKKLSRKLINLVREVFRGKLSFNESKTHEHIAYIDIDWTELGKASEEIYWV